MGACHAPSCTGAVPLAVVGDGGIRGRRADGAHRRRYHHLTKLGQSQKDLAANRPTPQDLEQLHQLINDPATAGKPKAREEAVWKLLDHISAQFLWCSDHPMDKGCGADRAASAK